MRKFNCFKLLFLFTVFLLKTSYGYSSEKKFIVFQGADNLLPIIESGIPMPVMLDTGVDSAVEIASQSLFQDFERVCG